MKRQKPYSESDSDAESDADTYSEYEEEYYSDTEVDYRPNVVVVFPKRKKTKIEIQREKTIDQIEKLEKQENIFNQILDSEFDIKIKAKMVFELANTSDKEKINTYLRRLLKIPHTELKFENKNILTTLRKNLDNTVYGHIETKEEIIDYMTSKINNPGYKSNVLALQGPPGVGKCHGKDTKILMYNGEYKLVQDIEVGDVVMGDDSTQRNVLSLGRGRDTMYEINHSMSKKKYIVNSEHILCLISRIDCSILEIPVEDFLNLPESIQYNYRGYSKCIDFPKRYVKELDLDSILDSVPYSYKINSVETRLDILNKICTKWGAYERDIVCILIHSERLADDVCWLLNSLGFLCTQKIINSVYYIKVHENAHFIMSPKHYKPLVCSEHLRIRKLNIDDYYGFTIDKNHRYIIKDFIVTHNTRFIRALGESLKLPFNQISFGGLNDPSILTGHDYTYIGSKPGKIYDALVKSKYKNCIIYLDEIDKISSPESEKFIAINGILTHMLDPEQNTEFRDNYLGDVTLDLSKVFFIISFNSAENIDPVVLNRLKVIEIKESSLQEKIEIVKKFSIPDISKNIGVDNVHFDNDTIKYIISVKTKEDKGMRNINKVFSSILSKINSILYLETMAKSKRDVIIKGFSYEKIDINKYRKEGIIHVTKDLVELLVKKQEEPRYISMYI